MTHPVGIKYASWAEHRDAFERGEQASPPKEADYPNTAPVAWEVECKTLRELGGGDGQVYALIANGPPLLEYIPVLHLAPEGKIILDMNTSSWCAELPAGAFAVEVTLREKSP